MRIIRLLIIFLNLFLVSTAGAFASDPDIRYDTASIQWIEILPGEMESYRLDEDFQYTVTPVDLNVFQQFIKWLFNELFGMSSRLNPDILELIVRILAIVLVIYALIRISGMEKQGLFTRSVSKKIPYEVTDENIHEIDFRKAIEEATNLREFRKAIRLIYLLALKTMTDKQYIEWRPGKTNHEYLHELSGKDISVPFESLSTVFEYTWYGNFEADAALFERSNEIYRELEKKAER